MPKSKRMFKHHLRELSKSFGSQIDPGKSEQLRRTKTDIENNLTRIQKLIKKEGQSKKEGSSRKETELVGLIEDFYNQYQSLYALFGRLAGEYVRSPRRTESVPSFSSSSSDSGYLSAEDVDIKAEISRERERYSSLSNTYENFRSASTETKEIEDHLTTQTKELVESLNQQKRNLELQVESQTRQVKQLDAKNNDLYARVLDLESLLKQSEGTVSILQTQLENTEDQATARIAESMTRINKLELEAKSLQNQKGKLEEKLKRSRNETLNFADQDNALRHNLYSAYNQNKELETQLEKEREKVSQYLNRIENLEEKLAESSSVEQDLLREKQSFLARVAELEEKMEHDRNETLNQKKQFTDQVNALQQKLDSACNQKEELETQLEREREKVSQYLIRIENLKESLAETTSVEQSLLKEKRSFLTRITELESRCRKHNDLQEQFRSEVDHLRLELNTSQEQNRKLESQNERSEKERAETLAKVNELEETIEQIRTEKDAKIWSKLKQHQQISERKMEELAEQFRKKMEDNIRILHRRIHVAEHLNNENRNSYKITKQRYEQVIKKLEDELKLRAMPSQIEVSLNGLELVVLHGLNLFEEHKEHVLGLVSRMLGEVQLAKEWVRKRNCEMEVLKDKVNQLTGLLSEIEQKVWKLEANVSKEGGEKLNLVKTVSQLEREVGKLEKKLKEKEEELDGLGEKKREAIRQLCFLVEFHRDRFVYLKDLMSKTRVNNR